MFAVPVISTSTAGQQHQLDRSTYFIKVFYVESECRESWTQCWFLLRESYIYCMSTKMSRPWSKSHYIDFCLGIGVKLLLAWPYILWLLALALASCMLSSRPCRNMPGKHTVINSCWLCLLINHLAPSLLRPQEQLRSIVMSTSVCVSVCPRGYLRNHTRDVDQIFYACCLCPWFGPPVACWP